ncbi:Protein C15B12.4 [Aphelenchoides avenae]|nr:Protein C15B12.4 [Aphelenchus avenae]KAH7693918.1 Protein C15B12.4 [Aphelenchus avenae]
MTGNAFLNLDGSGSSGNANMDAQGGGKGPSSALTSGALELTDGDNVKRNASVQGSVQADGDETSVRSISIVTDYGGKQSLSNYQNATSNSAGSSSAHASNAGVLKRKRRHAALGWLTVHVAPPVSAERIII